MTEWSIQRKDVLHGWFEGSVSCLGYSGVTEDGEIFMSMYGLRSSCLARARVCLKFVSASLCLGRRGASCYSFYALFFSLWTAGDLFSVL